MPKLRRFSLRRLKAQLTKNKLTPRQFTVALIKAAPEGLNPSPSYVRYVLNGRINTPSCDYLFLMAFCLGCSVDDLAEVVK